MLIRIWRTEFDIARLKDLEHFAKEISAPMFDELAGCLGYVYAHEDNQWITVTFWESREALAAAESSPDYETTVSAILAAGFLDDAQSTEVFEITSGRLPRW